VDRNLFERNCDVQAWTIFEDVILAAESGTGIEKANHLLKDLHQIYEVYHDIYLLNTRGQICSAAIRHELLGQDQSNREWFQQAVQGHIYFSDLYKSETTGTYTVAYSAPVKNTEGKIVGVLTTRFNWNYVSDIVNAAMVYSDCKVYLLNSNGLVIASSTGGSEILKKDFSKYESFRLASQGNNGFIEERDPETNNIYLIGYALTEGYNKYRGKGWIILILQNKGA
jgi:C4-dicarboxylate-specific signal transduction histidine kinase